jgi:nucleoid DNA-binding protein
MMDKLDEVMLQSKSVARISDESKALVSTMTKQMATILSNQDQVQLDHQNTNFELRNRISTFVEDVKGDLRLHSDRIDAVNV